MKLKNILALALALLMVMSFAACGGDKNPTEPSNEPTTTEPTTTEAPVADTNMSYFSLNITDEEGNMIAMSAYPNEDGTAWVQYMGAIRKEGNVEKEVLNKIAAAFEASGLNAFNGQEDYQEGNASAGMYICYTTDAGDEYVTAGYAGVIPADFVTGFEAVDAAFQAAIADMPEYVAQPMIMGELTEIDKTAIDAILAGMELDMPDSFAITNIPVDEYLASAVGMTKAENVVSAISFAPMMMSSAYSLNIVTVNDAANVEGAAKDLSESIDWLKWVCVQPSNALVAVKNNQALCLLASDDMYTMTANAIEAAGWTVYTTLENPNM